MVLSRTLSRLIFTYVAGIVKFPATHDRITHVMRSTIDGVVCFDRSPRRETVGQIPTDGFPNFILIAPIISTDSDSIV